MIVEFMRKAETEEKWYCIATKNLTVVPQVGTDVTITEEGSSHAVTYTVIYVKLDADLPKYIVYLS